MTQNVDLGGNTLYVNDIVVGDSTPGSLTGTSVYNYVSGADIIDATASTLALTASQSGSVVLLDKSGGVGVTLPAPVVGTTYRFIVKTVSTTGYTITTSATSVFYGGNILFNKAGAVTAYAPTAATDYVITLNGTTTGGVGVGDELLLICISSTEWMVSGQVQGSGTLATPFSA